MWYFLPTYLWDFLPTHMSYFLPTNLWYLLHNYLPICGIFYLPICGIFYLPICRISYLPTYVPLWGFTFGGTSRKHFLLKPIVCYWFELLGVRGKSHYTQCLSEWVSESLLKYTFNKCESLGGDYIWVVVISLLFNL